MKNTNILVVTENYTIGGLETHLYGKVKYLNQLGYKIFLVTGTSFVEENLPSKFCEKIYNGFNFSIESTSQDVIQVVQQLITIIKEERIEILDVHPFLSSLPAFFSAVLTQTPIIYTIHGPGSMMESYGQFINWFIKGILLPNASLVNNVSEETYYLTRPHTSGRKSKIFRNAVDINLFQSAGKTQNTSLRCCLVCRLDLAKVLGVKEFLLLAKASQIKEIDIYGDGPEHSNLAQWISENFKDSEVEVNLKGISLAMHEIYKDYSFVAGMGRVILEAVSMNKPVILVGYDGVKGLIDQDLLERASYANMSGRGLSNVTSEVLQQQLESLLKDNKPYLLAEWIELNANESRVWEAFSDHIQSLICQYSMLILDVYQCFVNDNSGSFYSSGQKLIEDIKNVLYSSKYLNSTASKLMRVYEQRSFEKDFISSIKHSEETVFSYINNIIYALKTDLSEQIKIAIDRKEQPFIDCVKEVKSLKDQLIDNSKRLEDLITLDVQKDQEIKALKGSLGLLEKEVFERETRLMDYGMKIQKLEQEILMMKQRFMNK